jgi:hypothetical protein
MIGRYVCMYSEAAAAAVGMHLAQQGDGDREAQKRPSKCYTGSLSLVPCVCIVD